MPSSTKPTVGLLFDVQALNQQNEIARKQSQKHSKQVKADELHQEQIDKAQTAVKKKTINQKDLLSKRKAAQEAMKSVASKAASIRHEKALKASEEKSIKESEIFESELEILESNPALKDTGLEELILLAKGSDSTFSEADLEAMTSTLMKDLGALRAKVQTGEVKEMEIDLDNPKGILDQLFDPENLIDSKATLEELETAKADAKLLSRMFRKTMVAAYPDIQIALAKALAQEGIDLTNPDHNPYALNEQGELINQDPQPLFAGSLLDSKYFKDATNPNAKVSIDQSIFASVFRAIEINELLQKLGIDADLVSSKVQNEMSKELIEETDAQFKKNADAIAKSHKQDCLQKTMRIVGDVVGALFIVTGLPVIGIPIILASEGVIKTMIEKMAKAFGMPEYAIQTMVMVLTAILAAPLLAAPGGWAAYMGVLLFVAGLVGWIENTVGAIATGQLDPEKFPEWVAWAAMGIEIGLSLVTVANAIKGVMSAVGKGLMAAGRSALNGARAVGSGISTWGAATVTAIRSASTISGKIAQILAQIGKGLAQIGQSTVNAVADVVAYVAKLIRQAYRYVVDSVKSFVKEMRTLASGKAVGNVGANGASMNGQGAVSGTGQQGASAANAASTTAGSSTPAAASSTASQQAANVSPNAQTASQTQALNAQAQSAHASHAVSASIGNAPAALAQVSQSNFVMKGLETVYTKVQQMLGDLADMVEQLTKKLLEKLVKLQDILSGGAADASQLTAALRGGTSVSERAQRIYNCIAKLIKIGRKMAKWLQLVAEGAQSGLSIEMAKVQREMGEILKEAAELSGEITIFEQFISSYKATIESLRESREQHGEDSAEQLEHLSAIFTSERRSNNLLMSA